MKKICKKRLTASDLAEIQNLIRKCELHDNMEYRMYLGDEDCTNDSFVLLYENNVLIGYVFCFSAGTNEVSGLIAPEHRCNGYFSDCLKSISADEYVFSGHENWPGYAETSIKLGFNFSFHEYLMEYKGNFEPAESDLSYVTADNQYIFFHRKKRIGHCSLYKESGTVNIFDVYVEEKYRNKGNGKKIIERIINELKDEDTRIILQVSEKNKPAYRLYLACGFEVIDSVLYYSRFV